MKKLLIVLSLLCVSSCLPSLCFSAYIDRYVNAGSTFGGNGTEDTLTGDNRAYNTLQNAFTAEVAVDANLTDNGGDILRFYLTGVSADTTTFNWNGFQTSSSGYVHVIGNNVLGMPSTSYYRFSGAVVNNYNGVINIADQYSKLERVEITNFRTADSDNCRGITILDGGEHSTIDGCIIHDNNTSTYYTLYGIMIDNSNADNGITVRNCLIYNLTNLYVSQYGIGIAYNYGSSVLNNTVYNISPSGAATGYGIFAHNYGGSVNTILKNNLSYNNKTADYSGSFSTSSTNNLSKDGTAPDYNVYYDSKTISFVNVSSGNFQLAATDTDAIGKGTDLSAFFTTDIRNVTRSIWDIGAFNYNAALTFKKSVMLGSRLFNAVIE